MASTAATCSAVKAKSSRTACARSTKSRTASEGGGRGSNVGLATATGCRLQTERRHRAFALAGEAQPHPAGDQNLQVRAGGEEGGDERSRLDHLLEVVEHQQQPPFPQGRLESGLNGFPAGLAHAEHVGDRLRHQARVADRVKRDVADPAGEVAGHGGRGRHGEPGLADPTGTGQGQQAILPAESRGERRDLALAPDEGRERDRERTPNREGLAGELVGEGGVSLAATQGFHGRRWGHPAAAPRERDRALRKRSRSVGEIWKRSGVV